MEPPQLAWVAWTEVMSKPPLETVVLLFDLQVTLKLPPPELEKLLRMPFTLGTRDFDASNGPNAALIPSLSVTGPVLTDRLSKGLAATRRPSRAPRLLPKNRLVV